MPNSIATNDVAPGILTWGVTLWYSADGTDFSRVPDLQEYPDVGNGGDADQIDVTTLVDPIMRYIKGLDAGAGGDGGLEFTGLYSFKPGSGFNVINSIANKDLTWQLRVSDGLTMTWQGQCGQASLTGKTVNEAMQFSFTVSAGLITYGGTYDPTLAVRDNMNGERIDVAAGTP